jgi:hypothetical protein
MKLLEVQPEIAPGAPPQPPEETPEHTPPEPEALTCGTCGATMAPGQDWCLECGTAARRLRDRPGARASLTVLGLTLLLVAGAVAASYAALRHDPAAPATQPAAQGQVAQTPPPGTTPPAATTTAPPATTTTPPAGTTSTPAGTTSTPPSTLPKVTPPSTGSSTPATPAPATPRAAPPATPALPAAPSTGSSGASGSSGSTGSSGSSGSSGSGTSTGTTTTPSAPTAIELAGDAASVYDPYRRATSTGDVGKALDGDGGTSWFVDVPAGSTAINLGYALNLGDATGIRSIDITTPTPGFRVEIYASDESTPPPDILDTRWAHITDKSDVGSDGETHIVLGAGSSKYRTLLLWITQPPSEGSRVRISELKVFG